MKNRYTRYNLCSKDDGKRVENHPVNLKRKQSLEVHAHKAVKLTNPKVFHRSYKKPHTCVITSSDLTPANCNLIEEDNQEYALSLIPYPKLLSFHTYSYIEVSNKIERLLKTLENRHKSLKPTKKSRNLKKEENNPNKVSLMNVRLELSRLYSQNIYKTSVISKLFNVTSNQLNHVRRKEKNSKAPVLESRGRKPKIQSQYLSYLENYLRNPNNSFTSLRNLKFSLLDHFNLNNDELSLTTIFRMVKSIQFYYKRITKEPVNRNIADTKELRKNLVLEILRKEDMKKTFIYIDESGFNSYVKPHYGYAKNKEPCVCKVVKRTPNFSLIAAMTENRVLEYQILKEV